MTKIIMSFDGTGLEGQEQKLIESGRFSDPQPIRIYFKGCHAKNVGGGYIFPGFEVQTAGNVR